MCNNKPTNLAFTGSRSGFVFVVVVFVGGGDGDGGGKGVILGT